VDERGETLRDVAFAKERALLPPSPPRPVRMTVAVPPGAKAVKHPLSGAWVPLAASTREWQFECSEGALPDRPIEFRPGTASIELQSWTDSALAHYSGAARYETEFDLPRVPRGEQLWLDLGEVGLAAEVWVNGRKAGERAWRPFRVNVTDFARPGRNTLLIRVANSSAGWESQGDTLYAPGAWGLKFKTERDRLATLRPNGLEGPVRVVAAPVR
jgi:hypothetical protein